MYECSRVCTLSLLHNTQHYTSKKKNNKKQQQLTQANTTWLSVFTVPQDDKTSEILTGDKMLCSFNTRTKNINLRSTLTKCLGDVMIS